MSKSDFSSYTIAQINDFLVNERENKGFTKVLEELEHDSRSGVQKLIKREKSFILKSEQRKQHSIQMYQEEKYYRDRGYEVICGVDEAGRGPLAGPVVAAAVVLGSLNLDDYYDDSKKLSASHREKMYDKIISKAISVSISLRTSDYIDSNNILSATLDSMEESIKELSVKPNIILVDGNVEVPNVTQKQVLITQGDAKVRVIAAASIIAKVYRDKIMEEYDKKYPLYKFSKHKGYGTQEHIELIKKYGPCEIHRKSFLENII